MSAPTQTKPMPEPTENNKSRNLKGNFLIFKKYFIFFIGLVWVGADKIYYFFDSILAIEIKSNYSFIALLLGILTFLTLWFFRTYDVREQIGQQDFHDALRMLADDKLVSQEIAVLRLIDISKKNKVYNDIIKLAFIKRMKAPYETEEVKEVEREIEKYKKDKFIKAEQNWQIKKKLIKVRRRTYAQYIFRWLGERYRVEDKLDLVNLDLSYQDFRARDNDGKKIKHFRAKKGNYFVLDFVNLRGANLKEVDLTEVDLREVDLTAADLRGVNLTAAKLIVANLTRADLEGANLTGAKLALAELAVANLTGADLEGAELAGANLTGAYLTGAKGLTYNQLASVKSLFQTSSTEL